MSAHRTGPTGPNGTWQAGDHTHNVAGDCVDLDEEQAALLNQELQEERDKEMAAELARLPYQYRRTCPKCGCEFPAAIRYMPEDAPCSLLHGHSEHLERGCLRCNYIWAEHLP